MQDDITDRLDTYFDLLELHNPRFFHVMRADNEEKFAVAVESAVAWCVREIEGNAQDYHVLKERGLSSLVAKLLLAAGIPASPETYHNGHVDIVVKDPFSRPFKVLGECKIWDGYQLHTDGCNQLLSRYMSGREFRSFCLAFLKTPGMYSKLTELRSSFDGNRPLEQSGQSSDHFILGAFVTSHRHRSGRMVMLLHLGCNLHVEK